MQQCLNTGENHIIITYVTKRCLHLAKFNRHTNAAVCNSDDYSKLTWAMASQESPCLTHQTVT